MLVTQKEYAEIHNIKFGTVREAVRRGCIKAVKTENGRRLIDSDDPWCLKHKSRMENLGFSYSRLHNIWSCMKQRCYNSKHKGYKNYGGRGVVVCDEWKDSAQAFCEWAKNNGYSDELEIDRIDVNGNYEPQNCRWVTHKENANNRRTKDPLVLYKDKFDFIPNLESILEWDDCIIGYYKVGENKCLARRINGSNITDLWSYEIDPRPSRRSKR